MKKFSDFLQMVQKQHSDEFQELQEILSRYQTLKVSNERLQEENRDIEQKIED